MSSSVVIIANPAARRASRDRLEQAASLVRQRGYDAEMLLTGKRGDAEHFARAALSLNPVMIIAAGGDGTINEVLNGIVRSHVPLGIIPLGTTNVLARELQVPLNVEGAVEKLFSAQPRSACLGKITLNNGISRYFCLMAGIGFDGGTVHDVRTALKNIFGEGAYIASGISNLSAYGKDETEFIVDGAPYRGCSAVIGKASRYGGDFRVTPDARLADPFLYACIFTGRKRTDLLRYVYGILRGRHIHYRDVLYMKAEHIETGGGAHIQIDGDYLGTAPAAITVERDAVKILW